MVVNLITQSNVPTLASFLVLSFVRIFLARYKPLCSLNAAIASFSCVMKEYA